MCADVCEGVRELQSVVLDLAQQDLHHGRATPLVPPLGYQQPQWHGRHWPDLHTLAPVLSIVHCWSATQTTHVDC